MKFIVNFINKNRLFGNILMFPSKQLKYGLLNYSLVLMTIVVMNFLSFYKLSTPEMIETLNAAESGIEDYVNFMLFNSVIVSIILGFFSYFLGLAITHRFVGPIIPIERHIDELMNGNYKSRVSLRHYDEMKEVGEKLNDLAKSLDEKTRKVSSF